MSPPEQDPPATPASGARKRTSKRTATARTTKKTPAKATKPDTAEASTEGVLVGMWSDAFGSKVKPHDSFVKLGGDSQTAATIAGKVQEKFGLALDLRVFATDLTVSALAAIVDQNKGRPTTDGLPPLRRARRMGPLSSAQERLWQSASQNGARRAGRVDASFRVTGPLAVGVLRRSIELMMRRHEILRTTFTEYAGRPMAVVRGSVPLQLAIDDLRGKGNQERRAAQIVDAELERPFDLEQGPLQRWRLLHLHRDEYRLLQTTHSLIHDQLSRQVFFSELSSIYNGLSEGKGARVAGPRPLQYMDYAVWERSALKPGSGRYKAELDWWRRQLEPPVPALKLPFARIEAKSGPPPGDGFVRWGIEPQVSAALDQLGRETGATFYVTRLAAVAALLALQAGADDFVIGTPLSTRIRAELHDMIGRFVNFGLLRLRFAGDPSFRQWLADVRRAVVDTSAHSTIPAQRLRRELADLGVKQPTLSATFVAWPGLSPVQLGKAQLEPLPARPDEGDLFRVRVDPAHEADQCWAEFDRKTHDRAGVEQFLARLTALMGAASAEPDRSLRDLHAALVVL